MKKIESIETLILISLAQCTLDAQYGNSEPAQITHIDILGHNLTVSATYTDNMPIFRAYIDKDSTITIRPGGVPEVALYGGILSPRGAKTIMDHGYAVVDSNKVPTTTAMVGFVARFLSNTVSPKEGESFAYEYVWCLLFAFQRGLMKETQSATLETLVIDALARMYLPKKTIKMASCAHAFPGGKAGCTVRMTENPSQPDIELTFNFKDADDIDFRVNLQKGVPTVLGGEHSTPYDLTNALFSNPSPGFERTYAQMMRRTFSGRVIVAASSMINGLRQVDSNMRYALLSQMYVKNLTLDTTAAESYFTSVVRG